MYWCNCNDAISTSSGSFTSFQARALTTSASSGFAAVQLTFSYHLWWYGTWWGVFPNSSDRSSFFSDFCSGVPLSDIQTKSHSFSGTGLVLVWLCFYLLEWNKRCMHGSLRAPEVSLVFSLCLYFLLCSSQLSDWCLYCKWWSHVLCSLAWYTISGLQSRSSKPISWRRDLRCHQTMDWIPFWSVFQ